MVLARTSPRRKRDYAESYPEGMTVLRCRVAQHQNKPVYFPAGSSLVSRDRSLVLLVGPGSVVHEQLGSPN